jgi:small subunit ribosomal protein S2
MSGIENAYRFTRDAVAKGGTVLFVATKRQVQDIVQEQAVRAGMPFVNFRWLGGMLTNFQTIAKRIQRMNELGEMIETGSLEGMTKKEALGLRREYEKLERNLGGLKDLKKVPDAIYILDTKKEEIAVREARKLGIPIVAVLDTNCDPDDVDFGIPGNDDAIRSGSLLTRIVADAVIEGKSMRPTDGEKPQPAPAPAGPMVETLPTAEAQPKAEWEIELEKAEAAAEVEPAPEPAAAEVEPAPEPAAAEVEPAPEPAAAEVEPAPEPAAAEVEPAPEPAAAEEPNAPAEEPAAEATKEESTSG